jgi:phosphoglycolate phosphatase
MGSVLTVGFDLDMTLIDSREGIAATFRAVSARTGVPIDTDVIVERLCGPSTRGCGARFAHSPRSHCPPLEVELAHWFPPEEVAPTAALYRSLYRHHAILSSPALPGAVDAVAVVRAAGGRVLVVTAKNEPDARRHLAHLGLAVADVVGLAWAEGKAAALRAHGACAYVGDHTADIAAGLSAGACPIGVATGPCTVDDLYKAGAATVLRDLTTFSDIFRDLGWAARTR